MWTTLHWIETDLPGRLGIAPRPRGGDWLHDELQAWEREGVSLIIGPLEPDEIAELELTEEQTLCSEAGIEFISLPIADRGVPATVESVLPAIQHAHARLQQKEAVVIHCRAGIGRSSLIAGCILVSTGYTTDQAVELIKVARGLAVPDTEAQLGWLRQFEARTAG